MSEPTRDLFVAAAGHRWSARPDQVVGWVVHPLAQPYAAPCDGGYLHADDGDGGFLIRPSGDDPCLYRLRRGDVVTDVVADPHGAVAGLTVKRSVMDVPFGGRLEAVRAKYGATGFEPDATDDLERSQVIGFLLDQIDSTGERLDRRMRDLRDLLSELLDRRPATQTAPTEVHDARGYEIRIERFDGAAGSLYRLTHTTRGVSAIAEDLGEAMRDLMGQVDAQEERSDQRTADADIPKPAPIDVARFVARHWYDAAFPTIKDDMSAFGAVQVADCVLRALGGETKPEALGVMPEEWPWKAANDA